MNKNDKKELERVGKIWRNESKRVHNFIKNEKYWSEIEEMLNKEIRDYDGYVYEDAGLIKGFMIIQNHHPRQDDIYICELFVEKQYQQRGIGTALLDLAKHCNRSLFTHVYVRSLEAVNWYFSRGLVIKGINEYEAEKFKDPNHLKYKMVWPKPLVPVDPR